MRRWSRVIDRPNWARMMLPSHLRAGSVVVEGSRTSEVILHRLWPMWRRLSFDDVIAASAAIPKCNAWVSYHTLGPVDLDDIGHHDTKHNTSSPLALAPKIPAAPCTVTTDPEIPKMPASKNTRIEVLPVLATSQPTTASRASDRRFGRRERPPSRDGGRGQEVDVKRRAGLF